MTTTIEQIKLFIIFLIVGMAIAILFDIFRINRKVFIPKKNIHIYIQDILFWILTGVILLYSVFVFNSGKFRGYMVVGVILGIVVYLITLSKIFMNVNIKILTVIKEIIIKLKNILIILVKYLIKGLRTMFLQPFIFFVINIKKITQKLSIKQYKLSKSKNITKKKKDFAKK